MSKELCFVIEGKELYMEQILVDYDNVPVFYVCNDGRKTYLVLRRDMEQELYVIAAISLKNLSDMLHGKITMREAFMREGEFWAVLAGEEICEDEVILKPATQMPLEDLPYEGACFQIAGLEMETYVKQVDGRLLNGAWESFWGSAWSDLTGAEMNWLVNDLPEVEIGDIKCEEYITKFSSFCEPIIHVKPLCPNVFTESYEWSVKDTQQQIEDWESVYSEDLNENLADAA